MSTGCRDVSWFVVWASIGGMFTVALLGTLTIGPFILAHGRCFLPGSVSQ